MNAIKSRFGATLMAVALVGVLCAGSLAGCAARPTWNGAVAAASKAIQSAGEQVDKYQKIGVITNAAEDTLIDKLKAANGQLRRADLLHEACDPAGCRTAAGMLAAVNVAATDVVNELLKQAAEKGATP